MGLTWEECGGYVPADRKIAKELAEKMADDRAHRIRSTLADEGRQVDARLKSQARAVLRDVLTVQEQGDGIARALRVPSAEPHPGEKYADRLSLSVAIDADVKTPNDGLCVKR